LDNEEETEKIQQPKNKSLSPRETNKPKHHLKPPKRTKITQKKQGKKRKKVGKKGKNPKI
jgi:hypothetical protein